VGVGAEVEASVLAGESSSVLRDADEDAAELVDGGGMAFVEEALVEEGKREREPAFGVRVGVRLDEDAEEGETQAAGEEEEIDDAELPDLDEEGEEALKGDQSLKWDEDGDEEDEDAEGKPKSDDDEDEEDEDADSDDEDDDDDKPRSKSKSKAKAPAKAAPKAASKPAPKPAAKPAAKAPAKPAPKGKKR
jgi:hypothetical protein